MGFFETPYRKVTDSVVDINSFTSSKLLEEGKKDEN